MNFFDDTLTFESVVKAPYCPRVYFRKSDGNRLFLFARDFTEDVAKQMINGKIDGAWLETMKWGRSCVVYIGPRGTRPDNIVKKKQDKVKKLIIKVEDA